MGDNGQNDDFFKDGDQEAGDSQPRAEKYNTMFLTNNIAAERRRTQLIVVGVVACLLLGAGLWAALSSSGEKKLPAVPPTTASPAQAPDAKADAQPKDNAEAKATATK